MRTSNLRNELYIGVDNRKRSILNQVISRGASWQTVKTKPFQLANYITAITCGSNGKKPVRVNTEKQITAFKNVIAEPFKKPYIYCIGGLINDSQAKLMALKIMLKAVYIQNMVRESNGDDNPHELQEVFQSKDLPLWHTLLGGFGDKLRDTKNKPSLLILSNLTVNSTPTKLEKLRDILEIHAEIPRIVIIAGTDPISFFRHQIFYPLHFSAYLTTNKDSL